MSSNDIADEDAKLDCTLDLIERRLLESLIDDETLNNNLHPTIRDHILGGLACDQLPNGVGEFGRDASQPIPVNGPLGELVYLSLLRKPSGSLLMFHRFGSTTLSDDKTNSIISISSRCWRSK